MKTTQPTSHKVSVHNHNQPANPKIGKYHYAMFLSSYGSPIYLTQYKVEYISLICYWIYVVFTVAFDTLINFSGHKIQQFLNQNNIVTDKIIFDHRVPYVIYWGPTYIYLALSVYAISTFLGSFRSWIQIFGILVYLWHVAYFIVFWAAPSVMLPKSVDKFQASAGYYWTELMLNLIMIIIQCGNTQATMNYPAYLQNYVTKVNNDIVEYLAIEDVEELNHETTPIKAQTPNQKSQIQSQKQILQQQLNSFTLLLTIQYKDESLFLLSYIKFMGNINICCVEQNDEPFDKRKYLFHKKLNNLNNQLISQIQYLAQLIFNCSAPRLLSITEKDPETKLEFYSRMKQEIELNQSNFFNLLIGNYFLHFNEIYADEEVIDIIQQFDTISQMLRIVIIQGFQQDLKLYFGNDLDKLPEQELQLEQLFIIPYLFREYFNIIYWNKFNKMLNLYYQQIHYDELNQSNVPEKGTVLESNDFEIDQALLPIQGGEIVNISNDSFLESSGGSVKPIQQQIIIQIDNIIENAEKQFKHLPYATTFEILSQMIKTTKPWKKFLLIEKFDNLITKTLLTNRDQNQLQSMQDILFAEDSRSDIYLYIFHSYGQQFKVDFKEHLLNALKLMWEFDGLLVSDIKYIYCPCFLRFTNVLEMYLRSVSVSI